MTGMRSRGSKSFVPGTARRSKRAVFAPDVARRLLDAGLRPTRQRLVLTRLLFSEGDRHVTAEDLHDEAIRAGERLSLATVYNALHQFTQAGLLRPVIVDGDRIHFDTNTSDHHHFYSEGDGLLVDIPGGDVRIEGLPSPPSDAEILRVDIIVRLKTRRRG